MSLIDQVKNAQEESFDKWFDRWYKKMNLESKIVSSAQQGYTGYSLMIKCDYENENNWNKDKDYTARRTRDSRTVEKLKEKLGEGFKVRYVSDTKTGYIFGRIPTTKTEDYISIRWEE